MVQLFSTLRPPGLRLARTRRTAASCLCLSAGPRYRRSGCASQLASLRLAGSAYASSSAPINRMLVAVTGARCDRLGGRLLFSPACSSAALSHQNPAGFWYCYAGARIRTLRSACGSCCSALSKRRRNRPPFTRRCHLAAPHLQTDHGLLNGGRAMTLVLCGALGWLLPLALSPGRDPVVADRRELAHRTSGEHLRWGHTRDRQSHGSQPIQNTNTNRPWCWPWYL